MNVLSFDSNKPFSRRWRGFPLTGGSFFLNMIINFIENYLANFTNVRFWWIYQAPRNFIRKTFFVIFYSCIRLCFSIFSILSEIGNMSTITNIDCKLLENADSSSTQTLLYGNPSLGVITNSLILNATMDFILSTKRFEEAHF